MKSYISTCISLLFFSLIDLSTESKCSTCEGIVEKFKEGLKKTAKSNFGGGNTRWEEKSLGTYAFSETRLLEILEDVCSSSECHSMLEHHEDNIETWWFKQYAKKKDTPLRTYLCIERVKGGCCEKGKWGPTCSDCPGGAEKPCSGEGTCNGDGTREGTGECVCNSGYKGHACNECAEDYFEESKTEEKTICSACHQSCKGGCSAPEPDGCNDCKDGWVDTDDKGCQDVNECEAESGNPCGESEYCVNTEGSYDCNVCHLGCKGCTGIGPDNCKECSENYYKDGDTCKACHESCENACIDGTPLGCAACKQGYKWDGEQGCVDINECETETCDNDKYCINTQGSFRCDTCNNACDGCTGPDDNSCNKCAEGFQLGEDGRCLDINECENPNVCGENEVCTNMPGRFTCDCKETHIRKREGCVPKPKEISKKKKKVVKASGPYKGPADCSTCKEIVESIFKGIEATSKTNFGGGNTKWEEEKLGPYEFSETRLTEILEHSCGDVSTKKGKGIADYKLDEKLDHCAHMLEKYEDSLENWWFKTFAKKKDEDLFFYLCIKTAEICCISGTFGKDCSPCPGGVSNPCSGNGKCQGEGTREGSGTCTCNSGYIGNSCDNCADSYFQESKNETHIICKACDPSCTTDGCDAEGPTGCHNCKDGYTHDDIKGCVDNDECTGTTPCSEDEYCLNTPGSYSCNRCDFACKGCHGAGSDNCLVCAERNYMDTADKRCKACDRACKSECTGPDREHCTGECRYGYLFVEGQGCQDVNECENGKHDCPDDKYCENTVGHFTCKNCADACQGGCTSGGPEHCKDCKEGYTKSVTGGCVDIDECLLKTAKCDGEKKKCVNIEGSYACHCEDGFTEEGDKCILKSQNEEDQTNNRKEEL